jgi:ribosomal protein S8
LKTSLIGKALAFGPKKYGFESRVFKILFQYCKLTFLINHIFFSTIKKQLYCRIIFHNQFINWLVFLKKYGLINNFNLIEINSIKFIQIFLNSFVNNIHKFFKLINKYKKHYYIDLTNLKLLHKRSGHSLYLLSTSHGILTHKNAIKKKTGGLIYALFR